MPVQSSNTVIASSSLCKSYGAHQVLSNVNLRVDRGKLVGFLGPNGAGKTTAIRVLLGLLKPTSGAASIFDKCVNKHGKVIRKEIGYLPGDVNLYSWLSGRQTLRFMASARRKNCDQEIERLSSVFQLQLEGPVRSYSTGMKQKLGLIQALMHRPQLLILDEPTSALDPLVRKTVFDELMRVTDEGRTVLFSSHSLDEVEQLCDEVIILRDGKIVEHQTIKTLQKRALKRLRFSLAESNELPEKLPDGLHLIKKEKNDISGTWEGDLNELVVWLQSIDLKDLVIERPDLNDLFLAYYSSENQTARKDSNG